MESLTVPRDESRDARDGVLRGRIRWEGGVVITERDGNLVVERERDECPHQT